MVKVLEFYSGIGGMHYALKASGVAFEVLAAFEINTTANEVYKHKFGNGILRQSNIEGLTVKTLDSFNADLFIMSPPCQPYTRNGKKNASKDARATSLYHILDIMKAMSCKPKYLLLENVKGFESSDTRDDCLAVLKQCGYTCQEFLLSPTQFGIPNSRLRYYLLAKMAPLAFRFAITSEISTTLPMNEICQHTSSAAVSSFGADCNEISNYVCDEDTSHLRINEKTLSRVERLADIVSPSSRHSCCFTKAYSHYLEGTGSLYTDASEQQIADAFSPNKALLNEVKQRLQQSLNLRYFHPQEIANLMLFPNTFDFPVGISTKQQYRLLGNSVNVLVVAELLRNCLLTESVDLT